MDQRFTAHRLHLAQQAQPAREELSDEEIKRIGEVYYAALLEEDDETRLRGFYEEDGELPEEPCPTFEEYTLDHEVQTKVDKHLHARGKVRDFYLDEAEEVLSWTNVGLRLKPGSPSWKKLPLTLQAANIKAAKDIKARNQGDVVETPRTPGLEPESLTPLLSQAVEEWCQEKARTSWVPKTEQEQRVWMGHFLAVIGDRPLDKYTKADARTFKGIVCVMSSNEIVAPMRNSSSVVSRVGGCDEHLRAGLPELTPRQLESTPQGPPEALPAFSPHCPSTGGSAGC